MKKLDYTEVTIKLMDEYTSKYLQENAELVQDTIKATLEAINYSQCCMGETVLDEDVSVNIEHKSLGKFTLVKKQDSETELLFCKCGLKKGGTFRCMRTDCDSMD